MGDDGPVGREHELVGIELVDEGDALGTRKGKEKEQGGGLHGGLEKKRGGGEGERNRTRGYQNDDVDHSLLDSDMSDN